MVLVCVFTPYVPFPIFSRFDKAKYEQIQRVVAVQSDTQIKEVSTARPIKNYVKIEEVPTHAIQAFLAVEDKRFYSHNGIDVIRMLSSLFTNVKSGSYKEGASTITQQLVKNVQLSSEKTLMRKINEIRIAQSVENEYEKEEILELYFNTVYFGHGNYGLASACENYFDCLVEEIDVLQAATLAAIINNPLLYSPYQNEENCKKRRNLVLRIMADQGFITNEEYSVLKDKPLGVRRMSVAFDHYDACVINTVKDLVNRDNDFRVISHKNDGLTAFIASILEKNEIDGYVSVLVCENGNGRLISNVSTFPYDVSSARFQPGSIVKPILCYAPLLEENKIFTCSPICDEPYEINGYSPSNYKSKYLGMITQSKALATSSNVVALKNIERIGLKNALKFGEKLGFSFDNEDFENYSIALGGMKYGLTLQEILTAYSTIANRGNFVPLSYVAKTLDKEKIVYSNKPSSKRVMKEETAFLLSDMLKDCKNHGTAKILMDFDNLRAKTGTVGDQNGNSACYCVAYTPRYTALCFVGKNDNKLPLCITGGTLPCKILKEIFTFLDDKTDFIIPDSVVEKEIDMHKWQNGQVRLASQTTLEKHKKNCYFAKSNIPQKYSSFDEFIKDNNLFNDNYLGIFHSFVD